MEPHYLSIYSLHPCPLFHVGVSVRKDFFSRRLRSRTPLAAMKLHMSWMISVTVATLVLARVLLALAVVSLYDVNFADSYEYIHRTSSSSSAPSSTTSPPTTSLSSKVSQVNSSSSSPSPVTATEACDLMRANVCQTMRRLVMCTFIDYLLQNIMKTPVNLLSTGDVDADWTGCRSRSRDQVFLGPNSMIGFIGL